MENQTGGNEPSKKSAIWQRVGSNLIMYKPKGTYYVQAKLGGKRVRETLKTDNLTVARTKLAEWLAMHRTNGNGAGTGATMGSLLELWESHLNSDQTITQSTREYKEELVAYLKKNWQGFALTKVRKVKKFDVERWRNSQKVSAPRINGCLTVLRELFDLAEARGILRGQSPMKGVKNLKVKIADFTLPTTEQLTAVRADIYERSKDAGVMFDLLSLSGARVDTIRHLNWEHVLWDSNNVKYVKAKRGGYQAPLFKSLRKMLEPLKPSPAIGRIAKVNSIRKPMSNACKKVGIPDLTHHDLRHWFVTRAIEENVDIPTISRWVGHKDGGALLMRTYGHLRDEHSQKMAERL
jgi:integrase